MSPKSFLTQATGARSSSYLARIQSLWSGYGEIARYRLEGAAVNTVILKHISPPNAASHPRGWATDRAHQRKLRSYEVESHFYLHHAPLCTSARVPVCYASDCRGTERWIALEDLNAAGFAGRRSRLSREETHRCLDWLASFHATFLLCPPSGLWPTGTYWHLATRPDELAELRETEPLKHAAGAIDARLNAARFLTFVHGDAKVANFCFSDGAVAAVDFQYVGGGVGVKDVAYFLGSVLDEAGCERHAEAYLEHYFAALRHEILQSKHTDVAEEVVAEWRALYPVAWADFHRFLLGWSPSHPKLTPYSDELVRQTLALL